MRRGNKLASLIFLSILVILSNAILTRTTKQIFVVNPHSKTLIKIIASYRKNVSKNFTYEEYLICACWTDYELAVHISRRFLNSSLGLVLFL